MKALRPEPEEKKAFSVVETTPGAQCQFDWSPYKLADDTPVQAWSCILSWSRGRDMEGTDNTKQTTILRMLDRSFHAFGGVPAQAVTDSMPGVVDRWESDRPILNIRFVDFAAYYDFSVDISPRRTPRYKGKVERSFWSAERSFLNGRTFHSMEQFRQALAYWLENTAHQWEHPVTKRPLAEMMVEERSYLKPLPAKPYDVRDVCIRIVDTQGFVLHETNRYRVPDEAIGDRVYLCVSEDRIEVFDGGVHRLADHERLSDGAGGMAGLPGCKARRRYDLDLLAERLAPWGQPVIDFVSALRSRQHYPGVHLTRLLNLQLAWSTDDIVKAVEHALLYHAHDSAVVERILKARFRPRTLDEQIAQSTRDHVRKVMQNHPVLQRPLSAYTTLACGDSAAAAATLKEEDDEEREE